MQPGANPGGIKPRTSGGAPDDRPDGLGDVHHPDAPGGDGAVVFTRYDGSCRGMAKGTVYADLLEKCPAVAVVDATVTDTSTEETVRRHELLFQFDAGRYREWTAGLAVWLEEGCKEIEPEPGETVAFSECDSRSFATPAGRKERFNRSPGCSTQGRLSG